MSLFVLIQRLSQTRRNKTSDAGKACIKACCCKDYASTTVPTHCDTPKKQSISSIQLFLFGITLCWSSSAWLCSESIRFSKLSCSFRQSRFGMQSNLRQVWYKSPPYTHFFSHDGVPFRATTLKQYLPRFSSVIKVNKKFF